MIEADEFRTPAGRAHSGRHWPFDPAQAVIPEAQALDGDGEYEVRLMHEGGLTSLFYQHHPFDVEGWRGDNFAFTFNIDDYNVITSDSMHLPPTVHLFMQATGVLVCNFFAQAGRDGAGHRNAHPGTTATSTSTRSRSSTADRSTASRRHPG